MVPPLPLKRLAFDLLGSSLALRAQLGRIAAAGVLTVLNLHRVDDREGSAHAAMNPAVFDELVGWLQRSFAIVCFRDLEALQPTKKPLLVLSFDDGYKDFIEFVVPILRKYGLQANQNVVPHCVAVAVPPMNVMLQDFIRTAPAPLLREIVIPGLPDRIDPDDRPRAALRASKALKNRPIAEQRRIFAALQPLFDKFDGFRPTPMMTVDDIRSVAAEHEIGMHSWEHATMAYETDTYLAEDVARCRAWSVERIGVAAKVYAFPNGLARAGQADKVRGSGFPCVLEAGEGFSRPDAWLHKRFTIYGATISEARYRAVGSLRHPRGAADPRECESAA